MRPGCRAKRRVPEEMFCWGMETEVVIKPADMILLLYALAIAKISSLPKQSPLLNLSSFRVEFRILSNPGGTE